MFVIKPSTSGYAILYKDLIIIVLFLCDLQDHYEYISISRNLIIKIKFSSTPSEMEIWFVDQRNGVTCVGS